MIHKNVEAHHEGLGTMLIAYFIPASLMIYLYEIVDKKNKYILDGLKIGIILGILWVFPHGSVMSGAHDRSIIYEIKNTIWHIIEQGIGGIVIAINHPKYIINTLAFDRRDLTFVSCASGYVQRGRIMRDRQLL